MNEFQTRDIILEINKENTVQVVNTDIPRFMKLNKTHVFFLIGILLQVFNMG